MKQSKWTYLILIALILAAAALFTSLYGASRITGRERVVASNIATSQSNNVDAQANSVASQANNAGAQANNVDTQANDADAQANAATLFVPEKENPDQSEVLSGVSELRADVTEISPIQAVRGYLFENTDLLDRPNGQKIKTLYKGEIVIGIQDGSWLKLSTDPGAGYIMATALSELPVEYFGYVKEDSDALIYPDGAALGTYARGRALSGVFEEDWLRTQYGGKTAYIHKDNLQPDAPAGTFTLTREAFNENVMDAMDTALTAIYDEDSGDYLALPYADYAIFNPDGEGQDQWLQFDYFNEMLTPGDYGYDMEYDAESELYKGTVCSGTTKYVMYLATEGRIILDDRSTGQLTEGPSLGYEVVYDSTKDGEWRDSFAGQLLPGDLIIWGLEEDGADVASHTALYYSDNLIFQNLWPRTHLVDLDTFIEDPELRQWQMDYIRMVYRPGFVIEDSTDSNAQ